MTNPGGGIALRCTGEEVGVRGDVAAKTSPPFTLALFNYVSLDGIASPPVLCGNGRTCARLNCVYDCPRPACRVPPASAVSNCCAARKRRDETRRAGTGRDGTERDVERRARPAGICVSTTFIREIGSLISTVNPTAAPRTTVHYTPLILLQ